MNKYPAKIKNEIISLRKNGFSYKEIQKTLNVPYSLVQNTCQMAGLNSGTISKRKNYYKKPEVYTTNSLSKALKDKVKDLYYSKSCITGAVLNDYVINEIHREYKKPIMRKRKRGAL